MSQKSGAAHRPADQGFTEKQGQYLAFIYTYSHMFRRPPAEADLQRHFQVSPASVHQMIVTWNETASFAVDLVLPEASRSSCRRSACQSCNGCKSTSQSHCEKLLGVYLAEAEASTRQLMDVLGHDDIYHAELYSREASPVRLAVQGMDRVVRLVTRKPLLGEPIGEPRGEPPYKSLINTDNGGPGGCLENERNQQVRIRWDHAAFKSVPILFNVFVPLAPSACASRQSHGA